MIPIPLVRMLSRMLQFDTIPVAGFNSSEQGAKVESLDVQV